MSAGRLARVIGREWTRISQRSGGALEVPGATGDTFQYPPQLLKVSITASRTRSLMSSSIGSPLLKISPKLA